MEKKLCDKNVQLKLQQDNEPLEGLPSVELPNTIVTKALQGFLWENDVILEISLKRLLEEAFPEKKEPIPGLQKGKLAVQLSAKEEPAVLQASKAVTAQENRTKAGLPQAAKGVSEIQEEKRTFPVLERNQTPVSLPEESEISAVARSLEDIALSLRSEKEAVWKEKDALQGKNKNLWEENHKMKQCYDSLKGSINRIVAKLYTLQQDLNSCFIVLAPKLSTKEEPVIPKTDKAGTAQDNRTEATLPRTARAISRVQEENRKMKQDHDLVKGCINKIAEELSTLQRQLQIKALQLEGD